MFCACLLIQTRFKSQSHMRSVPAVAKVVREKKVTQGFLKVGLNVVAVLSLLVHVN